MQRPTSRRLVGPVMIAAALLPAPHALAIGWEAGDFIVGLGNEPGATAVSIYDSSWNYKGDLDIVDSDVAAMTWLPGGLLAVAVVFPASIRVYRPDGELDFSFPVSTRGGFGLVYQDGLLYRPTADIVSKEGVEELDLDGNVLRNFGSDNPASVAVAGDALYSGRFESRPEGQDISIYDIPSGGLSGLIDLPADGQLGAGSMLYRPSTNTLLMHNGGDTIFERTLAGVLVRLFDPPPGVLDLIGLALGPEEEVLATDCDGFGGVVRWSSTGTLIGSIDLPSGCYFSVIWVSNRTIFEDGFESGDTSSWSATVP